MGWGDLAVNGNIHVSTPVIDKFAKQSLSFDRFYVCPLSAPTRAEMLTGRYFLRTGVSSVTQGFENMRTEEVTIAEILKKNGYTTGCFGKWHNGGYYLQHPNRQGFDEYVGFCMGHLGYYYDMDFVHNDTLIRSGGYTTDFFTGKAVEFIENSKDRPFFCYVPYNVPHSPFQVPEEYFSKYITAGLDSTLSSVYGMVENMDHNIGRIIRRIDELGLTENTIVVFFSDNGPNTWRFNGEMKGKKGSVDEGGTRTPFYIRWPGKINPGTTGQLGQDIDMLPTLLSLCGIKHVPEKPVDGIDLSGVILEKEMPTDRYIYTREGYQNLDNCSASVRNSRYRLVRTPRDTLLYDMISDPSQVRDISGTESEVSAYMSELLLNWERELVNDYEPVTIIRAGFEEEKYFILPVQDAVLTGNLRYSSIHPNQSHTEGWSEAGDSLYWNLEIEVPGVYNVELQYGCPPGKPGSEFVLISADDKINFSITESFESVILPERDYVIRSESVERTWTWMDAGGFKLVKGKEQIILKLLKPSGDDAGLIKAIKLTRLNG
jgi:arylsulfatase A